MVFREALDKVNPDIRYTLQIFTMDLDQDSIDTARAGVYPLNISADVSAARRLRFFVQEERGYRICKEIREMVIFAPQNVVINAPSTKLDRLSCRKLPIYLESDLQRKLLPLFRYSLNPDSVLVLGNSEPVGAQPIFSCHCQDRLVFTSVRMRLRGQPTGSFRRRSHLMLQTQWTPKSRWHLHCCRLRT